MTEEYDPAFPTGDDEEEDDDVPSSVLAREVPSNNPTDCKSSDAPCKPVEPPLLSSLTPSSSPELENRLTTGVVPENDPKSVNDCMDEDVNKRLTKERPKRSGQTTEMRDEWSNTDGLGSNLRLSDNESDASLAGNVLHSAATGKMENVRTPEKRRTRSSSRKLAAEAAPLTPTRMGAFAVIEQVVGSYSTCRPGPTSTNNNNSACDTDSNESHSTLASESSGNSSSSKGSKTKFGKFKFLVDPVPPNGQSANDDDSSSKPGEVLASKTDGPASVKPERATSPNTEGSGSPKADNSKSPVGERGRSRTVGTAVTQKNIATAPSVKTRARSRRRKDSSTEGHKDNDSSCSVDGVINGAVVVEKKNEASSKKDSASSHKDDASSKKDDASSKKDDASSKKDDASSQKDDASSQKNDSSSQKDDTSSQKDDASSQKDDASSQKDDASSQKDDASSQKDDASSQKDDASSQKDDTSSQKDDASSQKDDSSSQKGSSDENHKAGSITSDGDSQDAPSSSGSSRRRSSRIKSIEEKREKQREEKEKVERIKYEKRQKEEQEKAKKEGREVLPMIPFDELGKPPDSNAKLSNDDNNKVVDSVEKSVTPPPPPPSDDLPPPAPCGTPQSDTSPQQADKESPPASGTPQSEEFNLPRPEKVKSRWRRSSEMERAETVPPSLTGRAPLLETPRLLPTPPPPPAPPPALLLVPLPGTQNSPAVLSLENNSFTSVLKPVELLPDKPVEKPIIDNPIHQPLVDVDQGSTQTEKIPNKSSKSLNSESIIVTPVPAVISVPVRPPLIAKLPTLSPERLVRSPEPKEKMPYFEEITENVYLTERRRCKSKKEVRRMLCDCSISKEEVRRGVVACGEDCLNRLLMIECGSRCPTGEHCSNKRFQQKQYAHIEVFKTEMKGWGLQTLEDIPGGTFVMEYVGEVLDPREFKHRVKEYARDKNSHYYFMALKSDEIIDATKMGNSSRFINHSCSPNCETQKWTVNGELRIGFFSSRFIPAGEELTFDYQFQRYGKEAQKCFCMSESCRGFIGGDKQTPLRRERKETPSKRRKTAEEKRREHLEDKALEEEIEKLIQSGGLRNREQTLNLSRLMIRAEDTDARLGLLRVLQKTPEQACLRLFLDYHGLSLIWSWMADVGNGDDSLALKTQILQTLQILPISNKTMLTDSRVMPVVQRWSLQIMEAERRHKTAKEKADLDREKDKDPDSETTADSEPASQGATPRHPFGTEMAPPVPDQVAAKLAKVAAAADVCTSGSEDSDENGKVLSDSAASTSSGSRRGQISDSTSSSLESARTLKRGVSEIMADLITCVAGSPSTSFVKKEKGDTNLDSDDEIRELCSHLVDSVAYMEMARNSEFDIKPFSVKPVNEELKAEESMDHDALLVNGGIEDQNPVASLASKLLDLWSNLKDAYRIPKREQNQNRRDHEREADRRERERDRDSDSSERDSERYRARGKSRSRVSGRWDWQYDRDLDRDFDRDRHSDRDRKRSHRGNQSSNLRNGRERRPYYNEYVEYNEEREDSPESQYSRNKGPSTSAPFPPPSPQRRCLLPTPMTKEQRRHLFEMQVQKEEADEVVRKQQEELLRQQHGAAPATSDPLAGLYYDPNYPPPPVPSGAPAPTYFDPATGNYVQGPPAPIQSNVPSIPPNAPHCVDPSVIQFDPTRQPPPIAAFDPNMPQPGMGPLFDPNRPPAGVAGFNPPPVRPGAPCDQPPPHHGVPPPYNPAHGFNPGQPYDPLRPHPPHQQFDPAHQHFDPAHQPFGPSQQPQQFDSPQQQFEPAQAPQFDPSQRQFDPTQPPHFDPSRQPPYDPSQQQFDPSQQFDAAPQQQFDPTPQQQFDPTQQPFDPACQQYDPQQQQFGPPPQQSFEAPPPTQQFDPTQPPVVAPYDPGQPPPAVVYPQTVGYPPNQPPPFLPPPVVAQAPPPAAARFVAPSPTQPMYYPPQGVVASPVPSTPTAVIHLPPQEQTAWVQPHILTMVEESPPPALESPKPKPVKLPPNWKTAKDAEGRVYYYHAVTRQTQWEPPAWEPSEEQVPHYGTPPYEESPPKAKSSGSSSRKSKKKGESSKKKNDGIDHSSELVKRIKENFRAKMSQFIVQCLNPFRKPDCKFGRIISTEDFKHLARKLTHFVMAKELKHCRSIEDLECNDNVKHKAKDFVKKYMLKFGSVYRKAASPKDD